MVLSGIPREAAASIAYLLANFPCVAVLGARQVGKTTLLRELRPEAPTFDLERRTHFDRIAADPEFFLKQWDGPIVIDEAQELPALFPALRVAIDERRSTHGAYLLSGSSSPALLSGLTESLAGRVGLFELNGLTISEFWHRPRSLLTELISSRRPKDFALLERRYTTNELLETLLVGGYPEPVLKRNDPKFWHLWYENYLATYIHRDIRRLFPGLQIDTYQLFIRMLAAASGEIMNVANFARSLDVSQPTAKSYFRIAEGTFLWRTIGSFTKNVTKRVTKMPKGYVRDSGLVCHLLRIRQLEELRQHPRVGLLWESFVTEQLLRSFGNQLISVAPHYYRTQNQAEVDLVLEGDFGIVPIEIKLGTLTEPKSLRAISDFIKEHRCPYGIVINNSDEIAQLLPNIYQIPAACL